MTALAGGDVLGALLAARPSGKALAPDALRSHVLGLLLSGNETLRLSPAVWGIPRVPTRVGVGLAAGAVTTRVRRGRLATVYLRGIDRDPSIWRDPLRFDPSRHDDGAKEQHRALLPFGLGPRGCIGQHLALAELHVVLPALARRGHVNLVGTITEDANFALRVQGGLTGRFTTGTTDGGAR